MSACEIGINSENAVAYKNYFRWVVVEGGGGKGNIDGMKGGWSVIDDTIRLTQRCTTAPVRDHSRRLRLFFTSISSEKEKK